jgi:hypothetical protein
MSTDVSVVHVDSISSVEKYVEQGTSVNHVRSGDMPPWLIRSPLIWVRYVPPKCHLTLIRLHYAVEERTIYNYCENIKLFNFKSSVNEIK